MWLLSRQPNAIMRSASSLGAVTQSMKDQLRHLLSQRALTLAGPGESFTLSTGRKSKFYFNCKPITLSSDGSVLVADAFLEKISELPAPVQAIGGRTIGADPIVSSVVIRAAAHNLRLEGFLVREKQKAHGTRELIANAPAPGTRVVIVDDVITTGKSVIEAIDAAVESGCVVVGVISLMDRLEGGEAAIRQKIANYSAIFTRDDFPKIREAEKSDTTNSEVQSSTRGDSTLTTPGR
jgi:orotate phosphoribosyltransferase